MIPSFVGPSGPHDYIHAVALEMSRDPVAERRQRVAGHKQRSAQRVRQAEALTERIKALPMLTGIEAQHNDSLAAIDAELRNLVQQELSEPDMDWECISSLASIGCALQAWANAEASEYADYYPTAGGY